MEGDFSLEIFALLIRLVECFKWELDQSVRCCLAVD